jgi:hypothetical protein
LCRRRCPDDSAWLDHESERKSGATSGSLRQKGRTQPRSPGVSAVIHLGCVGNIASRVSDSTRDHAGKLANQILHSPKAATRKECCLRVAHVVSFFAGASKRLAYLP